MKERIYFINKNTNFNINLQTWGSKLATLKSSVASATKEKNLN